MARANSGLLIKLILLFFLTILLSFYAMPSSAVPNLREYVHTDVSIKSKPKDAPEDYFSGEGPLAHMGAIKISDTLPVKIGLRASCTLDLTVLLPKPLLGSPTAIKVCVKRRNEAKNKTKPIYVY